MGLDEHGKAKLVEAAIAVAEGRRLTRTLSLTLSLSLTLTASRAAGAAPTRIALASRCGEIVTPNPNPLTSP